MSTSRRSRSAPRARRPGILVSILLFVIIAGVFAGSAVARDATAGARVAASSPGGGALAHDPHGTDDAFGALDAPIPAGVLPPHNRVVVRRNVYGTGTAVDSAIDAYRRAVVAMKARDDTSKVSWIFQANVHGSMINDPMYNQCQHGSYFFLSWHRMYLYYFERIARRASGDSNFALPYWNYTDSVRWAFVPPQWRTPNDNTNPLWAPRVAQLNAGTHRLGDATIEYATAMSRNYFWVPSNMDPDTSFGGGDAAPAQFQGFTGALEFTPHNSVHSAIRGWMEDPRTAARDPIFWIHHSNIDRLWQQWKNRPAHPDPSDSTWLHHRFTFYDEDGHAVHLTGIQILNTADSLGYRYDPVPAARPRGARTLRQQRARRPLEVATATTLRGFDSVWVDRQPFDLGAEREQVVMNEVPGRRLRVNAAREVALSLEGLTFERNPGLMYDILIKPAGVDRDTVYMGTLEFFDLVGMQGRHDAHMLPGGLTVVGRVRRLPPAFARSAKVDVIIEPVSLIEGLRPTAQTVPRTRVTAVTLSIR